MIPQADLDPDAYTIVYSPGLPDAAAVDEAASGLDAGEQVRVARFRIERDAQRFRWRRGLRRQVLAGVLGVDPAELVFVSECPRCGSKDHGKPRLLGASNLHFSASQSGDATVVALGPEPFGVDLQAVSADLLDLGSSAFSASELTAVAASGKLADARRALLWARKEACLKAVGHGLAIDAATIDVLGAGFEDARFHPVQPLGQVVVSWSLEDGSAMALAGPGCRKVHLRAPPSAPKVHTLWPGARLGSPEFSSSLSLALEASS